MVAGIFFAMFILQSPSYEAIGFNDKHYLSAPIDGTHKIVVPYACSLYETKVFVSKKPSILFRFLKTGIKELGRAMIEIWWFHENYKPKCLVAFVGKKPIKGFDFQKNTVYESNGTIQSLRKVGTCKIVNEKVIFQLNTIEKTSPTVAIVRWMPDDLYKKYPSYFWVSSSTILLFVPTNSIVTPYLR